MKFWLFLLLVGVIAFSLMSGYVHFFHADTPQQAMQKRMENVFRDWASSAASSARGSASSSSRSSALPVYYLPRFSSRSSSSSDIPGVVSKGCPVERVFRGKAIVFYQC